MNGKELSLALKNGDFVYGTAILSPSSLWAEMVASLDLDLVFIDTEHTSLNRETVSWMCRLYRSYNFAPLVRISSPDPFLASMALDGGATGIIAPYIETADQVRKLAGAVKYKPVKGKKLHNSIVKKEKFEPGLTDYLYQHNQENILIVNIESAPALDALDEILAVEELDGVLIGPHDLSCSLNIPEQYRHTLFTESVETVIDMARSQNVGVGVHMWDAVGFDQEIGWAKKGANLIMHSSDIMIFINTLQKNLQQIKESIGEK